MAVNNNHRTVMQRLWSHSGTPKHWTTIADLRTDTELESARRMVEAENAGDGEPRRLLSVIGNGNVE
jgi:hypothetical protein